ncbi:iron hydrogenase [Trichomonas vaginalis G3]|uniref:Iron hydrogenase n=1 Tax=Trichomonas vaginalis (strain ATCC PRA-98 / G3) TaxID=412133 RepID=A2DQE9_TRIV3|nr:iron hydrogenase [Trichomonas vaginalis G3]EAY17406.1 iron hydrogenase [Trichomonas vaginalis G3]KAI5491416.1 iron hydrogenase [Trichomonas vaginalis G3]|eukprot:XP_001330775.1 iron hydrogenase [Trichomonas vaginalis G3]
MLASSATAMKGFANSLRMKDYSSTGINFDMTKCINCQSCVRACTNIAGQNVLKSLTVNGKSVVQTVTGKPLAETNCISCGQCTLGCPKFTIFEADAINPVKEVLTKKNGRIAVCQIAPAIRINMAEALGVPAGTISLGKVVTALKRLGFDYVFDTNFAADMTIVEEATELVQRLSDKNAVLPMFTSCCPAWVNYVEKSDPSLIPHLSSCRSPMSMLSSVIKNVFPKKIGTTADKIYNVAIMPCTAKKDEIQRSQFTMKDGKQETGAVLTSRELAKMIKEAKINFKELPDTPCDNFYSEASGGGAIFCATGGVMEAAVRSAYKFLTKKELAPIDLQDVRGVASGVKLAEVDIAGTKVKVAVAHGIKNAMTLIKKIKSGEEQFKDVKFVEVMACPGGCVVGGGSPKAKTKKAVQARLNATYSIDKSSKHRTSQDNPQLLQLYKESFEGKFGGHVAHHLLHTHYKNRKVNP